MGRCATWSYKSERVSKCNSMPNEHWPTIQINELFIYLRCSTLCLTVAISDCRWHKMQVVSWCCNDKRSYQISHCNGNLVDFTVGSGDWCLMYSVIVVAFEQSRERTIRELFEACCGLRLEQDWAAWLAFVKPPLDSDNKLQIQLILTPGGLWINCYSLLPAGANASVWRVYVLSSNN